MKTNYVVDNERIFRNALNEAYREVKDLTIPMTMIAQSWFKSNNAIFNLKSPGQYEDLMPSTKKQKQRKLGFIYPILKATGRLKESITDPGNSEAVDLIINKNTLVLGTKVPYAGFLHHGTKKMAARPVVFIGPESPLAGSKEIAERLPRWTKILEEFVLAVSRQSGAFK